MSEKDYSVPTTTRGKATYDRLLKIAEETFEQKGYHRTSVSEICRRADLANGTFYRYFPDKTGIFLQLAAKLGGGLEHEIRTAMEREQSYEEKFREGLKAYFDFLEQNVSLYQIFREAEFINKDLPQAFYDDVTHLFSQVLTKGIKNKELRSVNCDVVAHCLLGIANFVSMRWIVWEPGAMSEKILQNTMDFILKGIDSGRKVDRSGDTRRGFLIKKSKSPHEGPSKRSEITERSLLKAAERCFGESGFYQTTIADITREAGVAQGTFYLYFPCKTAIFTHLVKEINKLWRGEIRKKIFCLKDRREIEYQGFVTFFDFIKKHCHAYRVVREAEFVDKEIGEWYYRRFARGYVKGLKEGIARGEINRIDPQVLSYSLMGVGHFMGLKWFIWNDLDSKPKGEFEQMFDFISYGIIPK